MNHADFSLKKWFTREDFMDYGYILAEELVSRGEYYDAMILLEQIIQMEYSYQYFYIFFPEVIDFTLNILKHNIDGVISDELALDVYERALDLNLGTKNDAFFLRKMSEEYRRLGDLSTSEICLREAEKRM
jgi:tetratricopeptide (TPR) repeat protein